MTCAVILVCNIWFYHQGDKKKEKKKGETWRISPVELTVSCHLHDCATTITKSISRLSHTTSQPHHREGGLVEAILGPDTFCPGSRDFPPGRIEKAIFSVCYLASKSSKSPHENFTAEPLYTDNDVIYKTCGVKINRIPFQQSYHIL